VDSGKPLALSQHDFPLRGADPKGTVNVVPIPGNGERKKEIEKISWLRGKLW